MKEWVETRRLKRSRKYRDLASNWISVADHISQFMGAISQGHETVFLETPLLTPPNVHPSIGFQVWQAQPSQHPPHVQWRSVLISGQASRFAMTDYDNNRQPYRTRWYGSCALLYLSQSWAQVVNSLFFSRFTFTKKQVKCVLKDRLLITRAQH